MSELISQIQSCVNRNDFKEVLTRNFKRICISRKLIVELGASITPDSLQKQFKLAVADFKYEQKEKGVHKTCMLHLGLLKYYPLNSEEQISYFLQDHYVGRSIPYVYIREIAASLPSKDLISVFKTSCEQHNSRMEMEERKLNSYIVKRPKISISDMSGLIQGYRGERISSPDSCQCCGKPCYPGWRYKTTNDTYFLCEHCKEEAKPTHTPWVRIISTPMGNERRGR